MSETSTNFQFYRETNLKEVELNDRKVRIPEEWKITRLEEISETMYYGVTAKAVSGKTEFKMLRTTDINNYQADWGNLPFCEITEVKKDISRYTLKKGDLIIARAGTVGVSVVVPKDMPDTIFGSYLIKVVLNKTQAEPQFVHYYLQSPFYWTQVKQSAAGGVLKNINLPILRGIKLPLPPLEEQKKIAEVLKTIDEAIQAVEESIRKLERLKKGTMEQLLTKGIGHTKFKTVELSGRKVEIPEEWEVVELGNPEYFEIVMGQSPPSSSYNQEGKGMPFIQGAAEFGHIYVNPRMFTTKPLKIAKEGDIIISVRAPVGEVNIAPFELCIGRGVGAIRPNQAKVDTFFMYYRMSTVKNDLERLSGGAVFRAITKNTLKNFQIPLPPLEEQKQIAEILRTIDEAIEAKRQKKEKLERMKKAVMEKLLTGEVRIR